MSSLVKECLNCQNDFNAWDEHRFDGFCCDECEAMYKIIEEQDGE